MEDSANCGATSVDLTSGFTAVLRVKDEARPLPWVLPPLFRAVNHVVVVDNGSTDGTPDVARKTAAAVGATSRLDVHSYPHQVARCGPDHLATAPSSENSLTYFYNWSFAHVNTNYALKWDGDMLLTEVGVHALQDFAWQLESVQRILTMRRYPLYVASDSVAFLDVSVVNRESWGWPNSPEFTHIKGFEWEVPTWPAGTPTIAMPDWSCLEIKHLDADEFAHWSRDDFDTARTQRKKREWDVFQTLANGGEPPFGVVRIESPGDRHVIDYVREDYVTGNRDDLASLHRSVVLRMAIRKS